MNSHELVTLSPDSDMYAIKILDDIVRAPSFPQGSREWIAESLKIGPQTNAAIRK